MAEIRDGMESRMQTIEEWRNRVHPDLYGDGYSHGIIREMHDFMAVQQDRGLRTERSEKEREEQNSKLQTKVMLFCALIALLTLASPWIHAWLTGK